MRSEQGAINACTSDKQTESKVMRSHICRVKKAPIEVRSEQGAINACTSDKQTESKLNKRFLGKLTSHLRSPMKGCIFT